MRDKTIYVKPDEEITSVVDKLINNKSDEVFLIIPKDAVLTQSLVNLRLLKREADNLKKKITVITQDSNIQRMAKKVDFLVVDSLNEAEAISPKEAVLEKQISSDDFENLLNEEKRPIPLSMADIVKSDHDPKGKVFTDKIIGASQKAADVLFNKKEEPEENVEYRINVHPGVQGKSFQEFAGKDEPLFKREAPKEKEVFHSVQKISPFSLGVEGVDSQEEPYNFKQAPEKINFYKEKEKSRIDYDFEKKKNFSRSNESSLSPFSVKIFSVFLVAAFIVTGLVFYFILPKAEISISAKKDKTVINSQIFADKNVSQIDSEQDIIPAQLIKIEDRVSLEFPTTGDRQLNEKAKGTITVFNAYSSTPQTIIETTRFISVDGKIFRLLKTTNIPGAKIEEGEIIPSSIDVEVEADQPGSDYNIGPGDFTIPGFKGTPKYEKFYGKSTKSMSGGSTEKVKILTQEDINKAKEVAWDGLREKIKQEITKQIPSGQKFLDETIQIQPGETKSSIEVGGKAESFTITSKGIVKAIVFSEQDILELLKKNLSGQLNDKKELKNTIPFEYKEVKTDFDKGKVSFWIQGEQEVIWKIDQEEIKKIIAGKGKQEFSQIFSQRSEIEKAEVSLWPVWLKKIPNQLSKIKITVD